MYKRRPSQNVLCSNNIIAWYSFLNGHIDTGRPRLHHGGIDRPVLSAPEGHDLHDPLDQLGRGRRSVHGDLISGRMFSLDVIWKDGSWKEMFYGEISFSLEDDLQWCVPTYVVGIFMELRGIFFSVISVAHRSFFQTNLSLSLSLSLSALLSDMSFFWFDLGTSTMCCRKSVHTYTSSVVHA